MLRALNLFNDPTEAVQGARDGDSSQCDMSVGDIYGGGYGKLGLPAQMIASSFGKLQRLDAPRQQADPNDVSRSLLTMVSVNTLMFSKSLAKIEKIKNVVWIGVHIDILEYMQMSQYAFQVLTKGEAKLIFPTYHSFLGSLGLLLS